MAFLHQQADFFFRVGGVCRIRFLNSQPGGYPVRHMVQQPDKGIEKLPEDQHGQRHRQGNALHALDGKGLRCQFPQDDVQGRDDGKTQGQGHCVPHRGGNAQPLGHRQNQLRYSRLTNPAQAQGGQGNAKLGDGQ